MIFFVSLDAEFPEGGETEEKRVRFLDCLHGFFRDEGRLYGPPKKALCIKKNVHGLEEAF